MSTRTALEPTTLVFDVAGMDCGDCAKSVERVVGQLPDVRQATVQFGAGTMTVAAVGNVETVGLAVTRAVDRAGYQAALRETGRRRTSAVSNWRSPRLLRAAGAAVAWLIATLLLVADVDLIPTVMLAATIVFGGWPVARAALVSLRTHRFDMNVLMTISVIGAAILGEWVEGALVVVLFTTGTALQGLTFDRTRRAIRSLLDLAPAEAVQVRQGIDVAVAVDDLVVGDVIRVRPGDRVPVDGRILEGRSALTQAAITGESMPVDRDIGDEVFAGTINGSGMLLVEMTRPASESTLARIVHLVEEAQGSKAPSQQLIDRFSEIYTPVVVAAAAGLALVGSVATGDGSTWIYRALVLLVIACPCALVISTPVAIVSAIGAATRAGVLVKGGAGLEAIGRVRTVALDKTGTITAGRPSVGTITAFPGYKADHVLAIAAALEAGSDHPIARAIVARALHDNVDVPRVSSFEELAGRGVQGQIGGHDYVLGSDRLLVDSGVADDALEQVRPLVRDAAAAGASLVSVAQLHGDTAVVIGALRVADAMRGSSPAAIEAIRAAGVPQVAMLTGDRREVAEAIASGLSGVDVYADLLPADKVHTIEALRTGGPVAMVGDGINDAPALARADVGIAMGIGGSDVALESADLALMRDNLAALPSVIRLSQRTQAVIRQNITLSLATKIVALALGAFGYVDLWIAVLVDMGTSLAVTMNGLRLTRSEGPVPAVVDPDATCSCGESHEDQVPVQKAA